MGPVRIVEGNWVSLRMPDPNLHSGAQERRAKWRGAALLVPPALELLGTLLAPRNNQEILLLSSNVPHFIIFPAQFCMSKKYMNHKGSVDLCWRFVSSRGKLPRSENPDSGQHTVWFSSTYYQDTNVFLKMHILISGNQIPGISWRGWMSRFDGGQDLSIYRVVSSLSRDWSSLLNGLVGNRNENRLPRNRLDFPLVFNDRNADDFHMWISL